jgi:multidrug efflux pump subunit AcrA (membrane-fusion protein)
VLAVPAAVVQRLGTLTMVRAVVAGASGEVVESRYVRCGEALPDGRLEVLSGLQPGDRILARP